MNTTTLSPGEPAAAASARPGLAALTTVKSTGQVNINTAPRQVLRALNLSDAELNEIEQQVLAAIDSAPTSVDTIAAASGLAIHRVPHGVPKGEPQGCGVAYERAATQFPTHVVADCLRRSEATHRLAGRS